MKMPFSHCYFSFLLFVLCASLTGCKSSPIPSIMPTSAVVYPTVTSIPTIVPSRTSTLVPPTGTLIPTLSPTSSPIPPTRTRQPTVTPSATPAPTLPPLEEQALVLRLLRDNGGCQLPCWGGITPGETRWQTVEAFFLARGKQIREYRYSNRTSYTVVFDIPQHVTLQQVYYVSDVIVDLIFTYSIPPIRDDEFAYGDIQFIKDLAPYTLSPILTTYGQPAQILLGLDPETPWVPFELLLFYPERGILVRYSGPASRGEETFQVCPYRSEIALWLWTPEHSNFTLEHFPNTDGYTAEIVADIPSLMETTGITDEEFYQTFVQSGIEECFATLLEVWK